MLVRGSLTVPFIIMSSIVTTAAEAPLLSVFYRGLALYQVYGGENSHLYWKP